MLPFPNLANDGNGSTMFAPHDGPSVGSALPRSPFRFFS